jgi:hypothetical protein
MWSEIRIDPDEDLLRSTEDLRGGIHDPVSRPAEEIFRGFRDGLALYAEKSADVCAITDDDISQWGVPRTRLHKVTGYFFVIQSRDERWVGLQYQREAIVFARGLLVALELSMWYPTARGRGGFDIAAKLSTPFTADRPWPRFSLDYHLSEAGGFRLLRVLLAMGELLRIPVRLEECMDV